MYAGYDAVRGFQLYSSDPSGNFASWKAHATGKGCVNAISTLKEDLKPDCSFNEALVLALKVLGKSMDATAPNPDMFEVGILQKDAQGNLIQRKIEGDELMQIFQTNKIFDEEDSKK